MKRQQDVPFVSRSTFRSWRRLTGSGVLYTAAALLLGIVATQSADAQTFRILYSFTGWGDAGSPYAGVIRDSSGNLYGTTTFGHSSTGLTGTVFKLDSSGNLNVLHGFDSASGYTNGFYPYGGLILDGAGNLYGTTTYGGGGIFGNGHGGTVFRIAAAGGNLTVLHHFGDGSVTNDGSQPFGSLILDGAGNLYGTTYSGGSANQGTVFRLDASGNLTVLHHFGDGTVANDGSQPYFGSLILDSAGNLYGTTYSGGSANQGTVFKIPAAGGALTVLHSFSDGSVTKDGSQPFAGLILDGANNLYGTTNTGGSANGGTVFKLDTSGQNYTLLHSFLDGSVSHEGYYPVAGLVLDGSGNLYGTTYTGGSMGYGTVFRIAAGGGALTVLHNFDRSPYDGGNPYAGLILDALGNLYGATVQGGFFGYGTVFEIAAPAQAATQAIINQVNALYAQKALNFGQDNSLVKQLQQAISLMTNGKNAGAIENLQLFIGEVQDLQSSRVLTASQATQLISEANEVIANMQ